MPLVVGLTGGIGAGKSSVAALLADRGMLVTDVDIVGRQVLEPGGGAFDGVVEAFGPDVLAADGTIDRAALGALVFGGGRLDELEAISHPAINAELEALVTAATEPLVLDMAVLTESRLGWVGERRLYHRVIVVETPLDLRLQRLVELRGMTEQDARSRMATQAGDEDRRLLADVIVTNDGDLDDLEHRVERLWPTIESWALQVSSAEASAGE